MTRQLSAIAETILAHRCQAVALRLENATLSWDQLRAAVAAAEVWLNAQVAGVWPCCSDTHQQSCQYRRLFGSTAPRARGTGTRSGLAPDNAGRRAPNLDAGLRH